MKGSRGKIKHSFRASQQIDYSQIRYNNATPSDLDGMLELKNHLFVFMEFKMVNAEPLAGGQRMAIANFTDAILDAGKCPIAVIGEHNTPIDRDINAAESKAVEIRWGYKWHDVRHRNLSVLDCVNGAYIFAFNEEPPSNIINLTNKIL